MGAGCAEFIRSAPIRAMSRARADCARRVDASQWQLRASRRNRRVGSDGAAPTLCFSHSASFGSLGFCENFRD